MKATAWLVLLSTALLGQETTPKPATFSKDIAPLLFAHCVACHREDGVGPFPLLSYGDVKKRAKQLWSVVESKRMPPWKPVEGHGEFVGERRMPAAAAATLKDWVDQGCVEGDAKDLPPPPVFPGGWAFGEPDLVVTMPEAYEVPAEGRDLLRAFAIPPGLTEAKFIRAVQVRPQNPRVVHHAQVYSDLTPDSRKKDEADPLPGFDGWKLGIGTLIEGNLGKWNPGALAHPFPDGLAKELRKNADLVLQVHYSPCGKIVKEQTQVGFWFTKEPPRLRVLDLAIQSMRIDLPPDEKDLQVRSRYVVPVDVDLIGIQPHAHYLGRECKVWATDPTGKEIPIIWIKDWDFDWQEQYRYRQMIRLAKGTEIRILWTYDNTASNPRNPSNPPVRTRFGQQSRDEMAMAFLQLAISSASDRRALYAALFLPQEK